MMHDRSNEVFQAFQRLDSDYESTREKGARPSRSRIELQRYEIVPHCKDSVTTEQRQLHVSLSAQHHASRALANSRLLCESQDSLPGRSVQHTEAFPVSIKAHTNDYDTVRTRTMK